MKSIFSLILMIAFSLTAGAVVETNGTDVASTQQLSSIIGKWSASKDGNKFVMNVRNDGTLTYTLYVSFREGKKSAKCTIVVPCTYDYQDGELSFYPDNSSASVKWGAITGFPQREIQQVKAMSSEQVLYAMCGGMADKTFTITSLTSTKMNIVDENGEPLQLTKVVSGK